MMPLAPDALHRATGARRCLPPVALGSRLLAVLATSAGRSWRPDPGEVDHATAWTRVVRELAGRAAG
jgi:hypothetical protein